MKRLSYVCVMPPNGKLTDDEERATEVGLVAAAGRAPPHWVQRLVR